MQILAIGVLPLAALAHGAIGSYIGVPLTTALAGFLLAINMGTLYLSVPRLRNLR
jgi:hypothetical protein